MQGFQTTHWSLIVAARGDDAAARAALARLCETYWYPLYAYVRRGGFSPDDARDLTQGFFASLLERRDIENLRQERGRFRAFLLASLQHFIANDSARRRTQKRGGHIEMLPLAFDEAEGRYKFEPAEPATPLTLYERRWALTAIERVLARLRSEWEASGRAAEFNDLKGWLLGEGPPGGHATLARQLGITEAAARAAVHRLRKKFQKTLRDEIAQTVSEATDIEDEIRYLIRALNA